MSHDLNATLSRRQFIQLAVSSAGAFTVLTLAPALAADAKTSHWALFSDLHIKTEDDSAKPPKSLFHYNPHEHLTRAVREALAAKPDGLLITGDLARLTGDVENYTRLGGFLAPLAPKIPYFSVMGNHDDRDHFAQVFSKPMPEKQSLPGRLVLVLEQQPVRFILLDSQLGVNKTPGHLGAEQLEWLRGFLAKSDDRPTILCFHHNPTKAVADFEDFPQLLDIIRPCAKVKAIIYGHSHVYDYAEQDGIHWLNLPALGYSFSADQPVGWVDARLTAQAGEFTLHAIAGPGSQDGKTRTLKWR